MTTEMNGSYPFHYKAVENSGNLRSLANIGGTAATTGAATTGFGTAEKAGFIYLNTSDTDPGAGQPASEALIDFDITEPTDDYMVRVVLENYRSHPNYLQGFQYDGANKKGTGVWGISLLDSGKNVLCSLELHGCGTATNGEMVLTGDGTSQTMPNAVLMWNDAAHTANQWIGNYGVNLTTWLHNKGMDFVIFVKKDRTIIACPRNEQAGWYYHSGLGATYSAWHDSGTNEERTSSPLGHNWYSAVAAGNYNDPDVAGYTYIKRAAGEVKYLRVYAIQSGTGADGSDAGYRRIACYIREMDVVSTARCSAMMGDSQAARIEIWKRTNPCSENAYLFMLDANGQSFYNYSQAYQVPWWLKHPGIKKIISFQGGHDTATPATFLSNLSTWAAELKALGGQLILSTLYWPIDDAAKDSGLQTINAGIRALARSNNLPLFDFTRYFYDFDGVTNTAAGDTDAMTRRGWRNKYLIYTYDREEYAGEMWDKLVCYWNSVAGVGEDPSANSGFAAVTGSVDTNHSILSVAQSYYSFPSKYGMNCNFTSATHDADACWTNYDIAATTGVLTLEIRVTPDPTWNFANGTAFHLLTVQSAVPANLVGIWMRNESGVINVYIASGTTARTGGTKIGTFKDTNWLGDSGDVGYLCTNVRLMRDTSNVWWGQVDNQMPVSSGVTDATAVRYVAIGKIIASGDSTLRAAGCIGHVKCGRYYYQQEGLHFQQRFLPFIVSAFEALGSGACLASLFPASTGGVIVA